MYMTDFHTSRHIIQKIWISIAPFKELKRIGLAFSCAVPLFMMTLYMIQRYSSNYQSQFSTEIF